MWWAGRELRASTPRNGTTVSYRRSSSVMVAVYVLLDTVAVADDPATPAASRERERGINVGHAPVRQEIGRRLKHRQHPFQKGEARNESQPPRDGSVGSDVGAESGDPLAILLPQPVVYGADALGQELCAELLTLGAESGKIRAVALIAVWCGGGVLRLLDGAHLHGDLGGKLVLADVSVRGVGTLAVAVDGGRVVGAVSPCTRAAVASSSLNSTRPAMKRRNARSRRGSRPYRCSRRHMIVSSATWSTGAILCVAIGVYSLWSSPSVSCRSRGASLRDYHSTSCCICQHFCRFIFPSCCRPWYDVSRR